MGTRRPFSNVVLLPRRTQMNLAWQWHHDSTAAVSNVEPNIACEVACEQAHLRVTRASDEEQSDPARRSLVEKRQESDAYCLVSQLRRSSSRSKVSNRNAK